jgi:hypothetical protein
MVAVRHVRKRKEFNDRLAATIKAVTEDYTVAVVGSFYEQRTWDRSFGRTYRRSGEIVEAGPTRDAVDTGDLLHSIDPQYLTPLHFQLFFRSPYAAKVFLGHVTDAGHMIIGRPLPNLVAGETDWHQLFVEKWSGTNRV